MLTQGTVFNNQWNTMYTWTIVLLLLYLTGRVDLACHVRNCVLNKCVDWQCSECKPYYYGNSCQYNCLGCSDVLCGEYNGVCPSQCNAGYYKGTYNKCSQCRSTCSECDSFNTCTVCPAGSYLQAYLDGRILCNLCPKRCLSCTDYNICTQCTETSYWGTYCQNFCSFCASDCDKNNGCVAGCNSGYYNMFSETAGGDVCIPCPNACETCTSATNCEKCMSGFWGNTCENSCKTLCDSCTSEYSCNSCKAGYWGSYCQNSCTGCSNNICNKTQGCTSGCRDKYFMQRHGSKMYCSSCQYACKTCTNNSSCLSCNRGFTGSLCQHDCRSCDGQLCDRYTGDCRFNCTSNQFFDDYQISCKNCPNGCTTCTSSTHCKNCSTGQWGITCENKCNINCKRNTCDKNNGRCIYGCNDGFFGNNCSDSCLPGCKTCNYGTSCLTCKTDSFLSDNNFKCECTDKYCVSWTGDNCSQCSSTEWYPYASGCCPCSGDCENNTCFSNDTCINCKPHKYGDKCQSACSTGCRDKMCYRDGNCISCRNDFKYGPSCSEYCSPDIWYCNRCFGQDANSVTCTRCNDGRYVENNKCKLCSYHCKYGLSPRCNSTTGSCRNGCDRDYYGDKCDSRCNVTDCISCPANPNVCQECKDGFYGETTSICDECSANCRHDVHCDKYNGSCTSGCPDGRTGEKCNKSCPSGCIICEQYNSSLCGECKLGLYGSKCEQTCSQSCKTVVGMQVCKKSNGYCEHGCKIGFWGHACENDCGAGCNGSVCNRTSAACVNGCTHEYYGSVCKTHCSMHCEPRGNGSAERKCHDETGNCLLGCLPGWFGGTCENECSNQCNGSVCDRQNGTCTFGCNEGYTGSSCSQAKVSANEVSTDTAAIGAGAGAGVALLVIVVGVAAVIFRRRRRSSSKLDKHDSGVVQVSPDSNQTNPDLVYSNIDDTRTDGTAGVSNLLYANVRMSDVSKEEETHKIVEIARPVSEDYLKEEEIIDGEWLEEIESTAGEVDGTYYNVAGKRVAVASLTEYIRNKSREDIYADFQRIPKGLLKDYKEAKKGKNVHKNKYRFIYPYDESRVILQDGGSDYMNASYIEGYNSKTKYIASSGPFKKSYDTTPDFWRMIWQERCENIVMLTNPVENEETKCVKYWPEPGASSTFGKLQVTSVTEDRYSDFTIRILSVTKGGERLSVRHLHFTAWPDKGVPHDVTSMIEFRQKVRSLHRDKTCPLLVHCSAGIGRTGTFIALDMLTFEGEDRGFVDIFGCVAALRYQRCNMVQTKEQYDYLHHAVLHSLTFDCRSVAGDMFLQNYNKLVERNGGKRIIDIQFQHLQSTTDEMTDEDKAEVLRNQSLPHKNRDGADIPVDEYRVKLHENRKPGALDYINAVWINGFRTHHKFIVAQTPLPSTVVDFLTLVHQEKCSCIVMMEEADISNKSVGVYWPADNQSIKHSVFKISCKDSTSTQHYAKKTLSITCHGSKGDEIHDVHLFIFTNWPKGNAVPKTSDSVLQLVKAVDTVNRSRDKESTILVHCMTGSERSCVYSAVSILIEKMEIEHEVSVVNTLRQIKARRRSAFSTLDQYKFCHQAVISYLQSFDTYSNFGLRDSEASSV